MSRVVTVETANPPYLEHISIGAHKLQADEPTDAGGMDAGPSPYEFLLTALGTCTCITVRMYAQRKRWPLEAVRVTLTHAKAHAEDCVACESEVRIMDNVEVEISLTGNLSEEQRATLLQIAGRCPVHRTLTSTMRIQTRAIGSR